MRKRVMKKNSLVPRSSACTDRLGEAGFTLIEVLIVSVLMVTVGVGILGLQHIMTTNQILVLRTYLNVDQANANVSTIVKEIRNARASDNGSYPIEAASAQDLVIYSDIDFDNDAERVRYFLNGNDLNRGIIEPVGFPATYPSGNEQITIVTSDVQNGALPVFTYYNGGWPQDTGNNPLAEPVVLSDIKLVRVHLILNTDDVDAQAYELESFAAIRMLKDNL